MDNIIGLIETAKEDGKFAVLTKEIIKDYVLENIDLIINEIMEAI